MTAPVINQTAPQQQHQILQQNYQFAAQPQVSLSDFIVISIRIFISIF
jgi:hypothetical protein